MILLVFTVKGGMNFVATLLYIRVKTAVGIVLKRIIYLFPQQAPVMGKTSKPAMECPNVFKEHIE